MNKEKFEYVDKKQQIINLSRELGELSKEKLELEQKKEELKEELGQIRFFGRILGITFLPIGIPCLALRPDKVIENIGILLTATGVTAAITLPLTIRADIFRNDNAIKRNETKGKLTTELVELLENETTEYEEKNKIENPGKEVRRINMYLDMVENYSNILKRKRTRHF